MSADIDAGLVEALRRGDPDAGDQLVERYGDRIYRLALCITGVPEEAEEAAEDAVWTAACRIDLFKDESAFGSWIYRITAKAAYQKLCTRRQKTTEIALDDVLPSLDGAGRHFEPMVDWSNRVDEAGQLPQVLTDALDALPSDYRTALVLHDVEGMSSPDIAETLGLSPPAVRLRVHCSRLFVRKHLSEHFESASCR